MYVAPFDLLIDGYNLMHAAGFARRHYGPHDLQRQRERFVNWLWRRIPPNLRDRTVVVFDAGAADGQYVQGAHHRELRLLFSPRNVEADDLIEELIELHSAPRRLQVVSSDHRLHKAARKRRATCLDSEDFVRLMTQLAREFHERRRALEDDAKPTGELAEETQEWLRVFSMEELSDADVESLETPPLAEAAQVQDRTPSAKPLPASATPPQSPRHATDQDQAGTNVSLDDLAFWEERLRDLLPPR